MGMMDYDDAATQARGQTLAQDFGPPGDPGAGWVTFAALMLGIAGTFNAIAGIAAIADSRVYGEEAVFIFSNLNTWGWIVLLLGIAQVLAAFALFAGSEFARWFGIACAGVNAIGQSAVRRCVSVLGDLDFRDRHPDHLRAHRVRGPQAPRRVRGTPSALRAGGERRRLAGTRQGRKRR